MRDSSMGVTPRYGLSVSAVPPPTKPARSVPPRFGAVARSAPSARSGTAIAPMAATAAPRSRVPRETRGSSLVRGRAAVVHELLQRELILTLGLVERATISHAYSGVRAGAPAVTRSKHRFREARGCHVQRYAAEVGFGFSRGPGRHAGRLDRASATAIRASCCARPAASRHVRRDTGGSPWGAILGTDGAIYVTQGGNVPGAPDFARRPERPARARRRHRRAALLERSPAIRWRAPTTSPSVPTAGSGSPTPAPRATTATRSASPAACTSSTPRATASWCSSGPTSTRTASPSTPRAGCTGRSPWPTACAVSRTARRRRSRS